MAALVKINSTWVNVADMWTKSSGTWVKASEAYLKNAGVWTPVHASAPAPPASPILSLEIIRNTISGDIHQWLKVGARYPLSVDLPRLARIRVLWGGSDSSTLSTQFGNNFINGRDSDWSQEPWSDWYYHADSEGKTAFARTDTSVETFKQYPLNPGTTLDVLAGNRTYYVGAWSLDTFGQWSAGVTNSIFVPTAGSPPNTEVRKEARFLPFASGTSSQGVFTEGNLETRPASGVKYGCWFYGNQITSNVGSGGPPTITNARIHMTRTTDDGFLPTSNVYAFWHTDNTTSGAFVPTSDRHNITLIGTIAKGQTVDLTLPDSFKDNYNSDIKGLGIAYETSTNAAGDYSIIKGLDQDSRSGELHLNWTESV